jgi:hypothetical protein
MADLKISALTASTTPLAGTEVLPIVQSSTTKQVSVANLTAGRAVSATSVALNGAASALTPAFIRNGAFSCSSFGADKQLATFGAYNDDLTNGGFVLSALVTDVVTEVARGGAAGLTVTSGNLIIGTSGNGVSFAATPGTGTSELLADYEEGTFTPTLTYTGGNGDLSYSQQIGFYTLVGRCVTFEIRLLFGETTASGYISDINGLPFTSKSGSYAGGGMYIDNMSALVGGPQWSITPSTTTIFPAVSGTGGASVIGAANTGAANNVIQISGLYYV